MKCEFFDKSSVAFLIWLSIQTGFRRKSLDLCLSVSLARVMIAFYLPASEQNKMNHYNAIRTQVP